MQETKTGKRFRVNYCKFYVKKNWQILFFAILYITGLMLGVCFLYLSSQETLKLLWQISEAFLDSRLKGKGGEIFTASYLSIFWYTVALFLLGRIHKGKWLVLMLIWFRGLGSGLSLAGIYYGIGWDALPFMAAVVTPVVFCQAIHLLWSAKAVWKYQESILSTVPEQGTEQSIIRAYWLIFLLMLALAAVPAGLDAVLSACWRN